MVDVPRRSSGPIWTWTGQTGFPYRIALKTNVSLPAATRSSATATALRSRAAAHPEEERGDDGGRERRVGLRAQIEPQSQAAEHQRFRSLLDGGLVFETVVETVLVETAFETLLVETVLETDSTKYMADRKNRRQATST